jgi:hypothetical protein
LRIASDEFALGDHVTIHFRQEHISIAAGRDGERVIKRKDLHVVVVFRLAHRRMRARVAQGPTRVSVVPSPCWACAWLPIKQATSTSPRSGI